MSDTRIESSRLFEATAEEVFGVLCDPQGHVAIDATGMLQDATGDPVTTAGDQFVIHMDRESLGDIADYGKYDVTVTIEEFEQDRLISWTILGRSRPPIGHVFGYRLEPQAEGTLVTSFYDWSDIHPEWAAKGIFPVIAPESLKQTLGILDRTVRRGYPNRLSSRGGEST